MKGKHTQNQVFNPEFIIRLIEQDLKVHRVRRGLQELGFITDDFYTELPDMVFELLGYKQHEYDKVIELYFDYLNNLDSSKLMDTQFLKRTAEEVCKILTNRII